MSPQPLLTDIPGIFRCPECGLQNPRPIKKPFHHQCGPREPPPEPRSADDACHIADVLCPDCPTFDYVETYQRCFGGPCANGRRVAELAMRGCCPKGHF